MKYANFNGHHYGVFITYNRSYIFASLVENKTRVCILTQECIKSKPCLHDKAYAYVDESRVENCKELLAKFGVAPTSETCKRCGKVLQEYDFTKLLRFHNKEIKRDMITDGMVEVSDAVAINSSLVYYIYRNKDLDEYHLITTDGWDVKMKKSFVAKAVQRFNIPVYRSFRREPYAITK